MSLRVSIARLSLVALAAAAPFATVSAQGVDALNAKVTALYSKSMGEILPQLAEGQAQLWEASGKKDEASQLRAVATKAKEGAAKPDKDALALMQTTLTQSAARYSAAKSDTAGAMTAEAREKFLSGATVYGAGASQLKGLSGDLATLPGLISDASRGLNPMAARKVKSSIDMANALRDALTAIGTTSIDGLKAVQAYAASRKIELPKDLTSVM